MDDLFGKLKKLIVQRVFPSALSRLSDVVSNELGDARQKLITCDNSLRSVARICIDDAEDAYQEAIYNLKDGFTQEAFANCQKSLSLLKIANLHLSGSQELRSEPEFKAGSEEDMIKRLAGAISQFKTVIEYTNCDLDKEEHDSFMESVRLLYKAIDQFADGYDASAAQLAWSGLLRIYLLGCQVQERSGSTVLTRAMFKEHGDTDTQRLVDLIDSYFEARKLNNEASESARDRTNQYLVAARRTIDQALLEFRDGGAIAKLVKAGKMEVRMARRLIESSVGFDEEPQSILDKEFAEELPSDRHFQFKKRVAYIQQLIRENDPDDLKVVRRLHQVSSYYGRALRLKQDGSYAEAERYARSAHLDIDYARQLFDTGVALFSDTI